jgi:hypothetical protein
MGGGIIFHSENVGGGTRSRLQKWVFLIITYIDCGRQRLETRREIRHTYSHVAWSYGHSIDPPRLQTAPSHGQLPTLRGHREPFWASNLCLPQSIKVIIRNTHFCKRDLVPPPTFSLWNIIPPPILVLPTWWWPKQKRPKHVVVCHVV